MIYSAEANTSSVQQFLLWRSSQNVGVGAAVKQSRFGFGLSRAELSPQQRHARWMLCAVWFTVVVLMYYGYFHLGVAQAAPTPDPNVIGPTSPANPVNPSEPGITLNVNGFDKAPSTSVLVFLLITVMSVAPSLLLMMTSFTKIFIVLAMTRNALGLNQIPPNQVIAGLSVFLSLFIMMPTVNEIYDQAVKPYVAGEVQFVDALKLGEQPIRDFMGPLTREEDIALMTRAAERPNPKTLKDTPFTTLVPAFMISEVRSAFIIGFVVFIPFLVIDLIVGASLMSMGMMMLPPVMISLPFKVLLFVMVDGWGMLTETLVGTYR